MPGERLTLEFLVQVIYGYQPDMSVNDFLTLLAKYDLLMLICFIALPVLAFVTGVFYKRTPALNMGDYIYSIIIYLSGIPGIISCTLIFYALLITRKNLLDVNALLYFLPVISMVVVFYLIGKKTDFDHLPGFGRLSGLMLMFALVCIITLFLYKLHFFIGFFASIESLFVIGIILFALFKVAAAKISNKRV